LTRGAAKSIFLRRVVPATLCHAPIFARTAAPVPAPRSAPLCLGVSGWRPSSPRPLRPGIRNDHERSFTYGTRTPRSRWCSHAPRHIAQPVSLALHHWHCTTGTAPLALHHWHCTTALSRHGAQPSTHNTTGFTRCTTHLDAPTALSRSFGYSHPPSLPTTTLSRSLSDTPIHHLRFSTKITHSLATRKASLSQRHGTFLFFVVLF
jgi:hypothetical protein